MIHHNLFPIPGESYGQNKCQHGSKNSNKKEFQDFSPEVKVLHTKCVEIKYDNFHKKTWVTLF